MKQTFLRDPRRRLMLELGLLVAGAAVLLGTNGMPLPSPASTGLESAPPALLSVQPSMPATSPAPLPAGSPQMQAGAVKMPAGADCGACHDTSAGIGTKPIPPLGHPLEGWTNCVACHATDRLVQTAPGHAGLHASDCLICHKGTTPAAPLRGHEMVQSVGCLNCHGKSQYLPADMTHRTEVTCWLCHRLPAGPAWPSPRAL